MGGVIFLLGGPYWPIGRGNPPESCRMGSSDAGNERRRLLGTGGRADKAPQAWVGRVARRAVDRKLAHT